MKNQILDNNYTFVIHIIHAFLSQKKTPAKTYMS